MSVRRQAIAGYASARAAEFAPQISWRKAPLRSLASVSKVVSQLRSRGDRSPLDCATGKAMSLIFNLVNEQPLPWLWSILHMYTCTLELLTMTSFLDHRNDQTKTGWRLLSFMLSLLFFDCFEPLTDKNCSHTDKKVGHASSLSASVVSSSYTGSSKVRNSDR